MDLHLPNNKSSASAGGVKSVKSGFAPAADKPGILPVSVVAMVRTNRGFFASIFLRKFFAFVSLFASYDIHILGLPCLGLNFEFLDFQESKAAF